MIEFFKVTLASWGTRARVLVAQLRGAGEEGADDSAEALDGVEVAQPMGLRVRPVMRGSLEAIVAELGDERIALFLIDKSQQSGAVTPEAGETQLHGLAEQSAVIRIRASGDIEITPKIGADLKLNGSAVKAAADADPVDLGAWTFVPGTGGASLAYTPPGGTLTAITTGTAVGGKIAVSAARRVKTSA